jgi:hypothetical protein
MRYYLKHMYVSTECSKYVVIQAKYAYQYVRSEVFMMVSNLWSLRMWHHEAW